MLVDGTIPDAAYDDFMQFHNETSELGLRTCNLEAIMNEVRLRVTPSLTADFKDDLDIWWANLD
jgi:hypothetical protein